MYRVPLTYPSFFHKILVEPRVQRITLPDERGTMSVLYTVLFLMTFFMTFILVAEFRDRIAIYYVLLFVSVLMTNFGYMQMSFATNLESAMFANQAVYLGASFSPFFMLMCLSDLCKTHIKRVYQIIFLCCGGVIFFLSSSYGIVDWYYKEVSLLSQNGGSLMVKKYGFLHTLYPVYLLVIFGLCVAIIIDSFRSKREVSYITGICLLNMMGVIMLVYGGEKLFRLKVELLPVAYVIVLISLLILLRRISMFDVAGITAESMVKSTDHGFVLCDSKGRYLGSDIAAKNWFPEIRELSIDREIREEGTEFLKQNGKWIRGEDERTDVYINSGDRVIEISHSILREKRGKKVHCLYMHDDTQQQKYTKLVEQYNDNLTRDVNAKTERIHQIQNDIIFSMASIVENRDNNTGGHIARTSDVVRIFVKHLQKKRIIKGMTPEIAKCIIKAAPLHDFGKIAIPDAILNKPGKFEPEEYEIMKMHSAKGASIVERILQNADDPTFKRIAVNIAHYHHEKWNGQGYPEGIREEEIPFEARVMALADVFDALVSKRVYKDSFSYDKAFSIIEESMGTHFDPVLCTVFLECRPHFEALYNSYTD